MRCGTGNAFDRKIGALPRLAEMVRRSRNRVLVLELRGVLKNSGDIELSSLERANRDILRASSKGKYWGISIGTPRPL